jgi:two-component system, chemotaxis family, chemotaxis protein CheY
LSDNDNAPAAMKILVVDDEADVQRLFEQRFRREIRSGNMAFSFALSGEAALSYLSQHPSEVVMILSDINMPGMSGLELLRQLRSLYRNPPPRVMILTAYDDTESRRQALAEGADDFLSKPIDFAQLKEKLLNLTKE